MNIWKPGERLQMRFNKKRRGFLRENKRIDARSIYLIMS
jgi:hypothetical protein